MGKGEDREGEGELRATPLPALPLPASSLLLRTLSHPPLLVQVPSCCPLDVRQRCKPSPPMRLMPPLLGLCLNLTLQTPATSPLPALPGRPVGPLGQLPRSPHHRPPPWAGSSCPPTHTPGLPLPWTFPEGPVTGAALPGSQQPLSLPQTPGHGPSEDTGLPTPE